MKKYIAIAFIPSMLLTGCGKEDDTGTSTDATESAGTETDESTDETDAGSGTTHEVTTADGDMTFTPDDLTISVGDSVRFVMSPTHNAIEVSQETYDSRGMTPLDGGFQVTFSETKEVTFTEAGTHYYVCTPHVSIDMIGTITVE